MISNLTMSVGLVGEDDQTAINFAVITEVIVNTSSIVAQAQSGAIPLQQQINVYNICKLLLTSFEMCSLLILILATRAYKGICACIVYFSTDHRSPWMWCRLLTVFQCGQSV